MNPPGPSELETKLELLQYNVLFIKFRSKHSSNTVYTGGPRLVRFLGPGKNRTM